MPPATQTPPIPVLLLKTKSAPTDAYEELLAAADGGGRFAPVFVPVLEHRFDADGVARLKDLLVRRQFASRGRRYGGLIFTSQRAVEALAHIVAEGSGSSGCSTHPGNDEAAWPHLGDVPVYSVGPATTRALRAVPQQQPLHVSGEHTGNGEDLAYYIQDHYPGWKRPQPTAAEAEDTATPVLPPLLFVVGEKRRDIIPKVLMGGGSESGESGEKSTGRAPRIQVDEIVVYGTGVMASFARDFQRELDGTAQDRPVRWVVVFSPTGCDSMLAALGLLDPLTGRARAPPPAGAPPRTAFVATIGPTTRTYLRDTFGFEPDVCADEPSPQGVLRGITQFMASMASGAAGAFVPNA